MIAGRLSDSLVRFALRLVAELLFRVRILGNENIPSRGPALLVSNHLTYLDGFLIGSRLKPMVRFLVWKPYYDHKLLRWGFRLAKAIPVDQAARRGGSDQPGARRIGARPRGVHFCRRIDQPEWKSASVPARAGGDCARSGCAGDPGASERIVGERV